ncbi:hypothetical protein [Pendulispora albinea]|uniref:Uncharacterized protein n=1 Tax=Pendulispora albinea TaxID=2741071 RepID=A0ABZ2LP27_9BACT
MEGWAPFAIVPAGFGDLVSDDGPTPAGMIAAVEKVIDQLAAPERQILDATLDGMSDTKIARQLGRSVPVIRDIRARTADDLREALRSLAPELAHTSCYRGRSNRSPTTTNLLRKNPMNHTSQSNRLKNYAGRRCAQAGCEHRVSAIYPTRPELAPYCKVHRRLRSNIRLVGEEHASDEPSFTEPIPDHAAVRRLFESKGPSNAMLVSMTPEIAMALLSRSVKNRTVSWDRVAAFARDMKDGAWLLNNQGIGLGADGRLYDGQHRLWAVVLSGMTVQIWLIRGLQPSSRATIDQGRMRDVGDTLRIVDGVEQSRKLVSWLRGIEILVRGRSHVISTHVARRQLAELHASTQWLLKNGPKKKPYNRAPIFAAFLYAHFGCGARIEKHIRGYSSGAGLKEHNPMLIFRNHVAERTQYESHRARDLSMKTLNALLSAIREETMQTLNAGNEGLDYFSKLYEARLRNAGAISVERGVADESSVEEAQMNHSARPPLSSVDDTRDRNGEREQDDCDDTLVNDQDVLALG